MKRNSALAALVFCLASCKGSGYWIDRLDENASHLRANEVRAGAACAKLIPLELAPSLPVPERGAPRLTVLFYPASAVPGTASVLAPVVRASFSLDGPGNDRCSTLAGGGARVLGPAAPEGLSMSGYYRAQLAVYESLPETAALYARGGTSGDEGRKTLRAFADGFLAVAEPGLRAEYYALNPDFWEWLRKETGRALPAP